MSSSPERTVVLRGAGAASVHLARMDAHLHRGRIVPGEGGADPRLVDPRLEAAYERAVAAASARAAQEGYAAGLADGRAAAAVEAAAYEETLRRAAADAARVADERLALGLAALTAAVARLDAVADEALTVSTEAVTGLALDLAGLVVGRLVEHDPMLGADAVRRALTALPVTDADVPVLLRVHPDDLSAAAGAELPGRHVRVVADPDVDRGSCLAEAGASRVDARLGSALERLRVAVTA